MAGLRIALLDAASGSDACALANELDGARLIAAPGRPAVEALLRRRGFTPGLTHVPAAYAALARGGFDVVHAFTPADAVAAIAWRRRSGLPVVFTCIEPLVRERLADRRLRLWMLRRAAEESDALVAPDQGVRASLERWFALSPPVLASHDAPAHERLYRDLGARSSG